MFERSDMGFDLAKFNISVQTTEPALLVSWFQRCGKLFSTLCREAACRKNHSDTGFCCNDTSCDWLQIFGQKLTEDESALRRYQKPPLPFAFYFREGESRKEIVECELVIAGRAIIHSRLILNSFIKLCKICNDHHIPCLIVSIETADSHGNRHILGSEDIFLSDTENLTLISSDELTDIAGYVNSEITVRLFTPLCTRSDGHFMRRFDFASFSGAVMRRVTSIAYYYGATEFSSDFREISVKARKAACVGFHFERADGRDGIFSGITGYGTFIGDFSGLMPFLHLGSFLNAGRGAAYGMGKFMILTD